MHHFSLAGQSLRRADDFPSYFSLFAKKGLTTKLFDASKFTLTLEKAGSGKKPSHKIDGEIQNQSESQGEAGRP